VFIGRQQETVHIFHKNLITSKISIQLEISIQNFFYKNVGMCVSSIVGREEYLQKEYDALDVVI
jgi:hypothetical protein